MGCRGPSLLSLLEAQEVQTDSREYLGGKEGACTLPACRPAWGPQTLKSPATLAQVQAQTQAGPSQLHFLGFPADLVIVVNADNDKEEAAGQEQQGPQGHEACLSKCGSDHCERSQRASSQEQKCAQAPPTTVLCHTPSFIPGERGLVGEGWLTSRSSTPAQSS